MQKEEVIDLIKDAGFGVLATVNNNQPKARPMMPYLTEEGNLLLALLSHSRTIPQIQNNPLVEICYVDRKMQFCRIKGKAMLCEDLSKKEDVWNNVPMLRQYFSGPQDQNFKLVEISTDKVEAMTPHQKAPDIIRFK